MRMLLRQFVLLALIAGLLAVPLAFWLAQNWLADFAFRIELDIWPFAAGIALAVLITVLTVSLQSLRVARLNPVDSLRSE
jgi:putative ABC transport system permease protein